MTRSLIARATLVEKLETRLRAESFPRLIMTGMVSISGGIAFLCSAVTLWAGVYRSVRRKDDGNWLGAVWRRTWMPAVIVIVCVTAAGYLLQRAVPEARSIGGVIRALSE